MGAAATSLAVRLETDRLVLSPLGVEDAPELFATIEESRLHLLPWMGWAAGHRTVDETRRYLEQAVEGFARGDELDFGVRERAAGALIGIVGLKCVDAAVARWAAAYWLHPGAAGRGLAREAVLRVTRFAFEELRANRVELVIHVENVRSRALASALGFELEGVLRGTLHQPNADDDIADAAIYSMLRDEWLVATVRRSVVSPA